MDEGTQQMEIDPVETPKETSKAKSHSEHVNPSASAESAAEYPDMKLAQSIHSAILMFGPNPKLTPSMVTDAGEDLPASLFQKIVNELKNPSLYRHLSPILKWNQLSEQELEAMDTQNAKTLESLEEKVAESKENAGDMEVLEARIQVAKFAAKSLGKEEALAAYQKVLDLPKLSSGKQMDALMEQSRISSFYGDVVRNAEYLKKVSEVNSKKMDIWSILAVMFALFKSFCIHFF